MKFDLHTHHYRCGHASGEIRNYIEAGVERGLSVIGISDHSPFFWSEEDQYKPGIAMAKSDFQNYINEVLALKEEYEGKIDVLLGIESDFFPEHIEIYKQAYEKVPFDYIIGSVHFSGGKSIFDKTLFHETDKKRKVEIKEEYYGLIMESARSGMFQILGHIDAMKGFYPAFSEIATPEVETALKVIGECGIAIEVNTSAKNKDAEGWYPSDDILEKALYYGVDISFGSDSHVPERVGDEFELVCKKLKEIGFQRMVYYKKKQKQIVKI
ncbi:histidinol-phosphatase (PHP family) [Evansella vedderi]|uniref:Histidinol-phosphatase n=1 Tax=Evansella vedderi TaxID=38282 RepID=A0ABU0A1J2_9BACI|nr:histidinol-phosphatase [Evansella vedderi]MDQ0257358.1 histidinol-phosphatase (PHP family) [Evansella vedderi]